MTESIALQSELAISWDSMVHFYKDWTTRMLGGEQLKPILGLIIDLRHRGISPHLRAGQQLGRFILSRSE